jgi:DNA-directed RNA polymerase subunit omega
MARVTIEDCLQHVENMYELVHLATKRARQLYKGADPLVKSKNRVIVTALREIAAGRVQAVLPTSHDLNDDLPPMSN